MSSKKKLTKEQRAKIDRELDDIRPLLWRMAAKRVDAKQVDERARRIDLEEQRLIREAHQSLLDQLASASASASAE